MSLMLRRSRPTRTLILSCSVRSSSASACLSFRWKRGLATGPSDISASLEKSNKTETQKVNSRVKASGLKSLRNRNRIEANDASSHLPPRTILGQSHDLPIRARFAPSPTGHLHLGSLRTALFNNLSAKASKGGAFILRIEDTDQNRLVPGAEESLLKDLTWAGLSWDEGPDKGGPYGPYRQSERLPIYKDHIQTLIDKGHAYRCFCSPELLESQKRQLHDAGKPTFYPGTCRSIDAEESERRSRAGESHVVRLKADAFGRPKLWDAIYGAFQKKDLEEDFILMKTDGFPTYHFANVVDDHLMRITHVIRGEEWLISTPKHIALYEAFGWHPPTFAHMGLLVNADGTKLSKRHASVNIAAYREDGVLPMALLTWLATLGSSFKPGTPPPRTVEDITNALTFKFTRGGIKLSSSKLDHFNTKYRDALLGKPLPELAEQEARIIDEYFTQPMLREIEANTTKNSLTSHLGPVAQFWSGTLELVPALAGDATKSRYILKTLRTKQGGFQDVKSFVSQYPYLFWRVPTEAYQFSLSTCKPDSRILSALEESISHESEWDGEGGFSQVVETMRAILNPQGVDQLDVHNTLRLIGAGTQDVASPSSSKMFAILGREEWAHRLEAVRRIAQEGI